jgi:hypothetical protein
MSRSRSRKDVPDVQVPKQQATVWEIQSNAVLMELETRKELHHQNWGIDRLITLVDSEFRVKFWGQMGRVWDGLEFGDIERLKKAVQGMVKGYEALEKWGTDNGVPQNPPIKFLEWKTQDGKIVAVVQTINDSLDLQRERKDLHTIWTLEEFEIVLADPFVQEIMSLKALDPTAQVKIFKKTAPISTGSGFDDMEDDLEPVYGGTEPPKMFHLPHKK